jgi:hypothetical protein
MAGPQTPAAGNGPRRPRAWFARRMAAVLSAVAALGLGGLMYWNDHQPATAQAATASSTSGSTGSDSASGSSNSRASRSGDDEGEHQSGDDEGGSVVDDITSLIPGVSSNSSSSSNSGSSNSGTSNSGTSNSAPHTNTRGS